MGVGAKCGCKMRTTLPGAYGRVPCAVVADMQAVVRCRVDMRALEIRSAISHRSNALREVFDV